MTCVLPSRPTVPCLLRTECRNKKLIVAGYSGARFQICEATKCIRQATAGVEGPSRNRGSGCLFLLPNFRFVQLLLVWARLTDHSRVLAARVLVSFNWTKF